jgi:hypothetical protein
MVTGTEYDHLPGHTCPLVPFARRATHRLSHGAALI